MRDYYYTVLIKNQEGITHWFNYKGLTFVEKQVSIWDALQQ